MARSQIMQGVDRNALSGYGSQYSWRQLHCPVIVGIELKNLLSVHTM